MAFGSAAFCASQLRCGAYLRPCPRAGNAAAVRFIRNTPGLNPLAEKHASKLRGTVKVERRLVQAIVAPESPLLGEPTAGPGCFQAASQLLCMPSCLPGVPLRL